MRLVLLLPLFLAFAAAAEPPHPLTCNRVRFVPAPFAEPAMVGGKIQGSNVSKSDGFVTLAEVKNAPPAGQWSELTFDNHQAYRWLRYEGPDGSYGKIAEIEFYDGDKLIEGAPYGSIIPTPGNRWELQPDGALAPATVPPETLPDGTTASPHHGWQAAQDHNLKTWFQSDRPDHQSVALETVDRATARRPSFEPAPGDFEKPIDVVMRSTAGAVIRYTLDGTMPAADHGEIYSQPIHLEKSATFQAIAFLPDRAPSPPMTGSYLLAGSRKQGLVSFHLGNSLTQTTHSFANYARSAGYSHVYQSFTMPGALTKKLWDIGLNDPKEAPRWHKAWDQLAHIDLLTVQPRDFNAAEEADYEARFFRLFRERSPEMQPWLYAEWTEMRRQRPTDEGIVPSSQMKTLYPAATWEESMSAMLLYVEEVQHELAKTYHEGKRPRVLPTALMMGWFKNQIDHGKVPGLAPGSFYPAIFWDQVHPADSAVIHGSANGAHFVDLTWYAAFYRESPEGKVLPLETFWTPEQNLLLERLAWDVVKNYPDCGLYEEGTERVAAPQFVAGGKDAAGEAITLTSSTSGAWFRYTLDGTPPTRARGYVYCGVVTLHPGAKLTAIAYKSGMADSEVAAMR